MSLNPDMMLIDKTIIKEFLKNKKCKPLTPKQMGEILELMDHREQRAQLKGFADGKLYAAPKVNKEQLRTDLSISIQELARSNAQLATVLCEAIKRASQ